MEGGTQRQVVRLEPVTRTLRCNWRRCSLGLLNDGGNGCRAASVGACTAPLEKRTGTRTPFPPPEGTGHAVRSLPRFQSTQFVTSMSRGCRVAFVRTTGIYLAAESAGKRGPGGGGEEVNTTPSSFYVELPTAPPADRVSSFRVWVCVREGIIAVSSPSHRRQGVLLLSSSVFAAMREEYWFPRRSSRSPAAYFQRPSRLPGKALKRCRAAGIAWCRRRGAVAVTFTSRVVPSTCKEQEERSLEPLLTKSKPRRQRATEAGTGTVLKGYPSVPRFNHPPAAVTIMKAGAVEGLAPKGGTTGMHREQGSTPAGETSEAEAQEAAGPECGACRTRLARRTDVAPAAGGTTAQLLTEKGGEPGPGGDCGSGWRRRWRVSKKAGSRRCQGAVIRLDRMARTISERETTLSGPCCLVAASSAALQSGQVCLVVAGRRLQRPFCQMARRWATAPRDSRLKTTPASHLL
ncbi:hypothetical protein HPB48_015402 [Haemaphysalis longicornis]|uniref:Uncharacterized protein n=1 Tax=Haemaphysalis longicornis TaxID=44386 RepID=A0A9J6GTW5_HAELO|nr:hypothetical protein HPB48_015402 [Haemaphysalis longicornis]